MNIKNHLEYTLLRPDCTQTEIENLVSTALEAGIFGICVPPYWVKAASRLAEKKLAVVTVIGFPLGYQKTSVRIAEILEAIEDGADELDVVMNNAAYRSGMESWVKTDLARLSEICHEREKMLKVILETSLLTTDEIARTSEICLNAGADFIKTSTGFGTAGAQTEHIRLIRKTIGNQAGIKASGGIKTPEFAMELLEAGADRIGTSAHPSVFSA